MAKIIKIIAKMKNTLATGPIASPNEITNFFILSDLETILKSLSTLNNLSTFKKGSFIPERDISSNDTETMKKSSCDQESVK